MLLKEQLLALSFDDRLELYWALEDSVSPPDPYANMTEEEWIAELDRRAADGESGEDARKVTEELRQEGSRNLENE